MGCFIALLVIPFVTIPSIIYGLSAYILLPVSFLLLLFTGRPSRIQVFLFAVKLTPVFLIVALPIIFYFYVWESLGWIFFAWMLIYFLSRLYTGVHKKELAMIAAWKELASFTKQNVNTYVKSNPIIIAIVIALTIISILTGYFLGGLTGLRTGAFLAILIWWLTPYARETIKGKERINDNKE